MALIKCDECGTEISDKAEQCPKCAYPLPSKRNRDINVDGAKVLKVLLWIGAICLIWAFPYVGIPALVVWYLFWKKKEKFPLRKNLVISGVVAALFLIVGVLHAYGNRTPVVTLSDPQDQSSVQAKTVVVKGTVEPSSSKVVINGSSVDVKNGSFSYEVPLRNESNSIDVTATSDDGKKHDSKTLSVQRIFTPEELAEQKKIADEQEAEKQKALADQKQKLEAFYKTPAGKICKKNALWSESDCKNMADGKIWIGMDVDMLKAKRGLPDSANPSNYGSGTRWQWCWHDYSPSCYYDTNGDGLIDSYN